MDEKELKRKAEELRKRFGVSTETAREAASLKGEVAERMKEHTERMRKIREELEERKKR